MTMIHKITIGMLGFNIAVLLVVGYMFFHPVDLAVIYNEPFPVEPKEVQRGEKVSYDIHYNKPKQYRVQSDKNIICEDGNLVTLAPVSSNSPVGEYSVTVSVKVPEKTSLGSCFIQIQNTYYINAFRTVDKTMRTQDFIVY